ncbi:exosortase C-terminal domain/associated protein EpsI [Aquabacterium sp.]|uniref:exosortase C-terminal domain/associated protein EpsI n=1 Tax=Aquabacterium sp. TaxID=1872578 RepID=UPI003D6D246F
MKISLRTVTLTSLLLLAALLGTLLRPTIAEGQKRAPLDGTVPRQIGDWRELPNPMVQVNTAVPTTEGTSRDQPYDDLVSRTYVNSKGDHIMVALAYGSQQRQEIKIHRPELCYPAQGWQVESLKPATFPVPTAQGMGIPGFRLVAKQTNGKGYELVSYWIRIGNSYSDSAWKTRLSIVKEGLKGKMTDGVLVRVSQRSNSAPLTEDVFKRQEEFAAQLVAATAPEGKILLVR